MVSEWNDSPRCRCPGMNALCPMDRRGDRSYSRGNRAGLQQESLSFPPRRNLCLSCPGGNVPGGAGAFMRGPRPAPALFCPGGMFPGARKAHPGATAPHLLISGPEACSLGARKAHSGATAPSLLKSARTAPARGRGSVSSGPVPRGITVKHLKSSFGSCFRLQC